MGQEELEKVKGEKGVNGGMSNLGGQLGGRRSIYWYAGGRR